MKYFITSNLLLISTLVIGFCNIANAQLCSGTWTLQRPITSQCVSGQLIGWQNTNEPVGCPTNPVYNGTESNTFTFDEPVNSFTIDFRGFDGVSGCARIEIKVNNMFFPLDVANLMEIPSGHSCTSGSFSYITLTPDGYITVSSLGGQGRVGFGRIFINSVNTSSVTISSNDGYGTVFSTPFNCDAILPLVLEDFSGSANNCTATLNWRSGLEVNVRNIEVQRSFTNTVFTTIAEKNALGSNSSYSISFAQNEDAFYRLKINDWDETYQYSEVIHVKSSCNHHIYQIHPNPALNIIKISGILFNDRVRILDIQGRIVKKILTMPVAGLDIGILPSGVYLVQVVQENKIVANLKLVKQ
jgi:hypothetical protein